ncbi:MAG TPA: glycosyltransferase family A protein, partial [Nitrososphaera sp.]|nr:glycosyltransferase family A protein [Nitrososphaera sp.]
ARCLQSIRNQTYKNIEVLVIDALSSDDTQGISSELGAQVITLDGERTRAKNIGLLRSKGEFVFFVDSDMELEPCTIEECIKKCSKDASIAGVIVPERSVGQGFWVRVRDFERSFYAGSAIESARFFKKKFVLLAGGFDENYVFYEESTLHQKIEGMGANVSARISSNILHHEEDFNLRKWLRKKKYYIDSAKEYSKKYPKYAQLQTSIGYRMSLFTADGKWKRLVRHPVLAIGVFILKGLELFCSRH